MPNIDGFKERWGQAYRLYRRTHHEERAFNVADLLVTRLQTIAIAGAYATREALSSDGLPPVGAEEARSDTPPEE